jgi:lipopolysaccharide biosynthesis glycosyltransferase
MPQKYIAVTIDENYVQHCGVMLLSLFENNVGEKFHVFIIHNGITLPQQQLLKEQISLYNQKVDFFLIDENLLKNAPVSSHVSLATYYRILLPEVLPAYVSKVLFLDCDIIVRTSIVELWNEITEDFSHLAAENPLISDEFKLALGLSPESKYFNAGVMLINLDYWRRFELTKKSIDFIKSHKHKITFWDQDVLNNLLEGRWKEISCRWNAQEVFFHPDFDAQKIGISETYYNEVRCHPYIVHFTGSNKPWFLDVEHPYKKDYLYYKAKSFWAMESLLQRVNMKPVTKKFSVRAYLKRKFYQLKSKIRKCVAS